MSRNEQKRVLVLGSTGSVGTGALDVIGGLLPRFRVVGLSAGTRGGVLHEQVRRFLPEAAAFAGGAKAWEAAAGPHALDCELYFGDDGLCRMIDDVEADIVVGAITGWAGFRPCLKALERGCRLALANKETLVVGGQLVRDAAERSGSVILPVDSEESAIFQAMQAGAREEVRCIYLTASGGPFLGWPAERLAKATPEQALRHPNWDMGTKITIDSATLMNKALEIVETRWLFDMEPHQIKVLIHPQSIVHSMVEFEDGSIVAQLGAPDMRVPIQYALTYPDRVRGPGERLDFQQMQCLEMRAAGAGEFPALDIGFEVAERGGASGAVMNAANEVAVAAFLEGRKGFNDIVRVVEEVLFEDRTGGVSGLEELEQADRRAREGAQRCISTL